MSRESISACAIAQRPCDRPQVLPAYGLQDLRNEEQNQKTKSNPNTMCLLSTPGGNRGTGHFYLAKNRTFLLCVDTCHARVSALPDTVPSQDLPITKNDSKVLCSLDGRTACTEKFLPRPRHTGRIVGNPSLIRSWKGFPLYAHNPEAAVPRSRLLAPNVL